MLLSVWMGTWIPALLYGLAKLAPPWSYAAIAFGILDIFGGAIFYLVKKVLHFHNHRIISWLHDGELSENIVIDMEPYSLIDRGTILRYLLVWSEYAKVGFLKMMSKMLGGTGTVDEQEALNNLQAFEDGVVAEEEDAPPRNEKESAERAEKVLEKYSSLKQFFDDIFPFKDATGKPIFAWMIHARESELLEGDSKEQDIVILTRRDSIENEFLFSSIPDWMMGPWIVPTNVAFAGGPTLATVKMRKQVVPKKFLQITYGREERQPEIRILLTTDSNACRLDALNGYTQQYEEAKLKPVPQSMQVISDFVKASANSPIVEKLAEVVKEKEDLEAMLDDKVAHLIKTGRAAGDSKFKLGWTHVALFAIASAMLIALFMLK